MIEKKGGMMHAYANSKAHCTADWGQILINQLFALPSPKTQTAQSWTQSRDVLKCFCKMHRQWTCDERFEKEYPQKIVTNKGCAINFVRYSNCARKWM